MEDLEIETYLETMAKDGEWGGQLEMTALSQLLKFNVIVHQIGGESMVQEVHSPLDSVPCLHVSYHLGNHYNSVRPLQGSPSTSDTDDDSCVQTALMVCMRDEQELMEKSMVEVFGVKQGLEFDLIFSSA